MPEAQGQPVVIRKNGEVTGREMFKVRGDHVWSHSINEALRVHRVTTAFWVNYFKDKK